MQTEQHLLIEQARLEKELDHLQQILQAEVDVEVDECDFEIIEREKAAAVMGILRCQLQDIQAALRAVEKGLYGLCERCGGAIEVERLEVKPGATFCLACQRAVETTLRRSR
jgi:RNA polymerase-binding transcription factor DksA